MYGSGPLWLTGLRALNRENYTFCGWRKRGFIESYRAEREIVDICIHGGRLAKRYNVCNNRFQLMHKKLANYKNLYTLVTKKILNDNRFHGILIKASIFTKK